jgi:Holliday junction DNA helicase RuvA
MIGKLTGTVDSLGEDWAILDVQGVGYILSCSGRTLARLGRPGTAASLYTEMRIRDEVPHLYGFGDRAEQEWFRLLTTVQGVGGRVGLAILSVLDAEALALAIASGDKAALARADGVGPKLAARISAELKDRAQTLSLRVVVGKTPGATGDGQAPASPNAEAVSALVNLGYARADAFAAVAAVSGAGGTDQPLGEIIRKALRELSGGAKEIVR